METVDGRLNISGSRRAWTAAGAVFLVFGALAVWVWQAQRRYQRAIVERHTQDVCIQASRRLQVFVESHLRVASIFAARWSTHEGADFSKKRFDEFAAVVVDELPGFAAIALIGPDARTIWTVPESDEIEEVTRSPEWRAALGEIGGESRAILSPPRASFEGKTEFFALLPLVRDEVSLGHLLVLFHSETLMNDCFHERIRSEFHFQVRDAGQRLFQSDPGAGAAGGSARATVSFGIRNRTWRLTMVLKDASPLSWLESLAVLLLGLILSLGLGVLTLLLVRRVDMYRGARDKALLEIAERERAEANLKSSWDRYHSVFEAATDGLIVLSRDGRIVEANRAAATIHAETQTALIGRDIRELIAPEKRHLFEELKRQLASVGAARFDAVDVRRDGARLDVEVRGTTLNELQYLVIISDVSERNRAIQRLTLLSRKAMSAQEEERARLSHEMHDELGQILTALRLNMELAQSRLKETPGEALDALVDAIEMAEKATAELRRLCRGLRPPLLDDLGLAPAIRSLIDEFQTQSGIRVDLELPREDAGDCPSGLVALSAYRILQESLTNIRRHSRAKTVDISLVHDDDGLTLSIYDDGEGFEMTGLGAQQGCGLEGMRERANLANGHLDIRSAKDQGTRVVFWAPFLRTQTP